MTRDKILILTANPRGTAKLRLDEEVRDIKEGLRQAKERDRYIIESEWAVRPKDIRRAILYSKPQIIHFSGHGSEDGGLAFENEVGQIQLLNPEALAGLFKLFSEHVRCVLLNACYSEIQADAIVQHIDFVVGMSKEIGDRAAIEFSVGFYDALGAGCSVKTAYEFGCNAIQMAGIAEYSTPVLRCKNSLPITSDINSSSENSQPKDSITRSLDLELSSKVIYSFVVTGSIDEVSKQKLEVVVAHLREITGDTSLTLLKIEPGSIRLVVKGSPEGFKKLKSLVESGQLSEILDMPVQGVKLEEGSVLQTYSETYQQASEASNSNALVNLSLSEPAQTTFPSTDLVNKNENNEPEPNSLISRQGFLRIIGAGILGVAATIIAFVGAPLGSAFSTLKILVGLAMKNSKPILFAETSAANIVTSLSVATELTSVVAVLTANQATSYIIPDPNNPLQGTYSSELRFKVQDSTGKARVFTVSYPKFLRESSESSTWELDPQFKEVLISILESKD